MILRVFPRRTSATPTDHLAFVGDPPLSIPDGATEVHVSCAFTWDMPRAEELALSWSRFGLPVSIGGPTLGIPSGDFVPGRYLRDGYTITSRGCPNRCWFCSVWRREQGVRELPIMPGWILQDDNLLACRENHILSVFEMLREQQHPIVFSGGIEADLLQEWHIDLLTTINVGQIFCAYDTADDLEPLRVAGDMLNQVGITFANRKARAYVLCGYPQDTISDADHRMMQTIEAGFMPQSMLYRDSKGAVDSSWGRFHRLWARPAIIAARHKPTAAAKPDNQAQLSMTDQL